MPVESRTFSESWYRISDQRLSLRPSVRTHRQFFRGEKWHVLQDPYANRFFRLRPAAYEFVARLSRDRTVEEVWKQCLELCGESAPGQQEVIQLLAQLYHANLLQYQCPSDSLVLFKRYRRQREQEIKSRLLGFMFPRFTLIDPDWFLRKTLPAVGWIIGPVGAVLWLAVVAFGIKCVVDNFGEAVNQSQGVLAPGNLVWLYVGLVISKVLHEFGHAYLCRKTGGEVHRMGVMLLIFTPLPFMDATSSWSFRSRWRRALVGAAGMITELFVAAVAAVVWRYTGEGLLHRLCYNIMFTASISTVLFNANPLLRFDGYYILSDILDIPNLHTRAWHQLKYVFERFVLGYRKARSLARTGGEAVQLFVFAVLSGLYRIVVFTSIVLFVADQLFIVGVIVALFCLISWLVVPLFRFCHYLLTEPKLSRSRLRAVASTAAIVLIVVLFLRMVRFPSAFAAPGVLEAARYNRVHAQATGELVKVHVAPGHTVKAKSLLAELNDPSLVFELQAVEAKLQEVRAAHRKALQDDQADLGPIEALRAAITEQRSQLQESMQRLKIRAEHDGLWDGPDLREQIGTWVAKGTELGAVIDPGSFEFSAIVSQSEASRLFGVPIRCAELKLMGQAEHTLAVSEWDRIPMDQQLLPSQALGWQAGGEIATDFSDPTGLRAREPFFWVIAKVPASAEAELRHGLAGQIRFRLPDEPLLPRWTRKFRQLLQRRYQL